MNNTVLYPLVILVALVSFVPAVAHADTSYVQQKSEHSSVKTRKAYVKHQKKQAKKARAQQKKSIKAWKKEHGVAH
ncbi:hypothetical protein GCM10011507_11130 [Edaphobacter acidisoli]|uniref:Acid-shock protein n=1 Tax=Edaphobacter acidisoli TaxID=2040573 RepID=A0A916RL27_9BACT|nr:hypothetical protein [Edaphobacter acidisoli]GGA61407.1 hypothetical protein GCM10011507_11130 [Edaphobacter acidisoli]